MIRQLLAQLPRRVGARPGRRSLDRDASPRARPVAGLGRPVSKRLSALALAACETTPSGLAIASNCWRVGGRKPRSRETLVNISCQPG